MNGARRRALPRSSSAARIRTPGPSTEIREHCVRMPYGIGDLIGLEHAAVGSDEDGYPARLLLIRAFGSAIGHAHRPVGIIEKLEGV